VLNKKTQNDIQRNVEPVLSSSTALYLRIQCELLIQQVRGRKSV